MLNIIMGKKIGKGVLELEKMQENIISERFRVPFLLLGAGLFLASVGIAAVKGKDSNNQKNRERGENKQIIFETEKRKSAKEEANIQNILVDVSGAVIKPGVYELGAGARVKDGLIAAGGLSAGADREFVSRNINLAAPVADGAKIYIPYKGQNSNIGAPSNIAGASSDIGGLVNINTASSFELERLPRVGPAIAERIIDYRTQNGRFEKIEDIKKVRGIGDKMFEEIRDRITVY